MQKARGAGLAFDEHALEAFPLSSDCCATLHDSRTWKFKAWPAVHRPIGTTPTEYVHRSAIDRWLQAIPEYRPAGLTRLRRMDAWCKNDPRPVEEKV